MKLIILRPFLIGIGAFAISFIIMMSAPPLPTFILVAILYFLLGIWIGRKQPNTLWYAPLLMNILIWIIFIPMGMDILPPKIHIWYFLIPPVAALLTSYLGMYTSRFIFKNSK